MCLELVTDQQHHSINIFKNMCCVHFKKSLTYTFDFKHYYKDMPNPFGNYYTFITQL